MDRATWAACFLLVAATVASAQPQTNTPRRPAASDAQAASAVSVDRYRIQKGDSLEITFPFAADFNQTKTVQPDGFIFLRSVGDLMVVGLTVTELQDAVKVRYVSIMRDAAVSVELKDFERPYFVAVGSVERPGKYELRGVTTVTQALAVAGGFKPDAKRSKVILFRRAPTGTGSVELRRINVGKMLDSGDLKADLLLEPGDLLSVSKSRAPSLLTIGTLISSAGWVAVLVRR
ncbi:MAG: polysaccharide biosynthesis/export family protein [Vicinamibacterales bacterium]